MLYFKRKKLKIGKIRKENRKACDFTPPQKKNLTGNK